LDTEEKPSRLFISQEKEAWVVKTDGIIKKQTNIVVGLVG
jgi:hypothetical protein